jgi:hypothetical protein
LTAQLERVLSGAPSAVDTMATETGSKDKYFEHFIQNFQTAANKLKEEQKSRSGPAHSGLSKAGEVEAMLRQLRTEMPDNLFNPVLSIRGTEPSIYIVAVDLICIIQTLMPTQTHLLKYYMWCCLESSNIGGVMLFLDRPPRGRKNSRHGYRVLMLLGSIHLLFGVTHTCNMPDLLSDETSVSFSRSP